MSKETSKHETETMFEAAELLGTTFIQRRDIFASQLEDGRYVAVKEPLTTRHLVLHLEGHITLGTYILSIDSTTRQMVLDADEEDGLRDLCDLAGALDNEGVPTYLETSRRGGHLRFFFDRPISGERVRAFGKAIIDFQNLEGIELFPKQDKLFGGPGSLVRLPFGRHKLTGQRYPFIYPDGELLAPTVREQIHVLWGHKTVPNDVFESYTAYELEKRKGRVYKAPDGLGGSKDVETIKNAVSLMDFLGAFVDLRPVASGAIGHCPFHEDRKPSFGVNREGNYWNCFAGCGGGSIVDFWMKWRKVNFSDAMAELKEYLGVDK